MKPIHFEESNCIYAKDQPEYLPLPAYKHDNGVTHCWYLNFMERIKILFTGRLWIQVLNFGKPLQPIKPIVDKPLMLS